MRQCPRAQGLLRELTEDRTALMRDRSAEINRVHRRLEGANQSRLKWGYHIGPRRCLARRHRCGEVERSIPE